MREFQRAVVKQCDQPLRTTQGVGFGRRPLYAAVRPEPGFFFARNPAAVEAGRALSADESSLRQPLK
jgi:hypothetical protein